MNKLLTFIMLICLSVPLFAQNESGEPKRGDILVADGRILATSRPSSEISVDTSISNPYIRMYPYRGLAGRTIGYMDSDPDGNFSGLEGAFNIHLRSGGDVVSTIDINIQEMTTASLHKQLQYHNAHHGTAVVMEVATGEIKAITNLCKDESGNFHELYNYALGESVEPGSLFELMSYMAVFEGRNLQLTDSVDNGSFGAVYYYGKKVHDDNRPETMGRLSVEEAFVYSSNISVSKFINQHYRGQEKQFVDRLCSMNLSRKFGLELEGESEPDIRHPGSKYWTELSLIQMACGYEIRLAPIHVLAFYNAVANDGKMVKPRFVKSLTRNGVTEQSYEVQVINPSIASTATIAKAKKMMEAVVEYGTSSDIKTDLYKIVGKPGTALVDNEKYGYKGDRRYYSSFAGYFPADLPKYTCIVSIYAPTDYGYSGEIVAAPVFREIADKIFAADSIGLEDEPETMSNCLDEHLEKQQQSGCFKCVVTFEGEDYRTAFNSK